MAEPYSRFAVYCDFPDHTLSAVIQTPEPTVAEARAKALFESKGYSLDGGECTVEQLEGSSTVEQIAYYDHPEIPIETGDKVRFHKDDGNVGVVIAATPRTIIILWADICGESEPRKQTYKRGSYPLLSLVKLTPAMAAEYSWDWLEINNQE